jgi:hypothetical protein
MSAGLCGNANEKFKLEDTSAIIVSFTNPTAGMKVLHLPLFSQVVVHTRVDSKAALAMGTLGRLEVLGRPKIVVYDWTYNDPKALDVTLEIPANATGQVIYLLPKVIGDATIELAGIGSFSVVASNNP